MHDKSGMHYDYTEPNVPCLSDLINAGYTKNPAVGIGFCGSHVMVRVEGLEETFEMMG